MNGGPSLTPRTPSAAWIWVAALGTIAIDILFANRRGLWLDEYITLDTARLKLPELVANRFEAGHSPLHFIFAKLFLVFGDSERVLRLSSALPAGLAAVIVMLIAARAGWRRAFPALALTCIFCPYWIETGTMFRYMMPLACGGALMHWALYRHQLDPRLNSGIVLALLTALCLWIHFSAQFVVLGLIGFVIADTRARRIGGWHVYARRLAPLLVGYALGLPFVYLIRNHPISNASESFEPRSVVEGITEAFYSTLSGWPTLFDFGTKLAFILFVGLLIAALWFSRRSLRATPEGATLARMLAWSVLGSAGAILIVQILGAKFKLESRYVSALSPALVLSVGIALHALLNSPGLWRRLLGATLAISIAAQASFAALTHGDGHRDVVRWVMAHAQPEDTVFVTLTHANRLAFRRNGNKHPLLAGMPTATRDPADVQTWIKSGWGTQSRGFVLFYKSKALVDRALEQMISSGEIVAAREWTFSGLTRLYIYIRSEQDRAWLEQFSPPSGPLWNVHERRLIPNSSDSGPDALTAPDDQPE